MLEYLPLICSSLIVILLIFRSLYHRFQKYNRENTGLSLMSIIVLIPFLTIDRLAPWEKDTAYILIIISACLFVRFLNYWVVQRKWSK
ncbi:glucan phosphoethanolaminetransferase (alkaline phosphatase superfamily) [Paenibacillus sp. SORGH_AS306]|uniref:hypothetical protein n=1 Tax=unclassified Paenibacillus TaxID=185978 RepID=UPI002788DF21|nr:MULTISPECIES: hypothetical protein [unclassified Paenibacillus]MDQ1233965.1 glucan phosphoethanolaminetransferase (alkaline phosphatase superfamily) [Paenibacillus sp. SORGH_AS_0306]MDR6111010.1 glucan phosphoethanolaminetransferase (alkaline phosphatase superfamily) [Paenibacillus sp. SORGH_AS_0338]